MVKNAQRRTARNSSYLVDTYYLIRDLHAAASGLTGHEDHGETNDCLMSIVASTLTNNTFTKNQAGRDGMACPPRQWLKRNPDPVDHDSAVAGGGLFNVLVHRIVLVCPSSPG
jgi:hypothetical protein